MAIEPIENGEDGLSVRNKLNALLAESSVYLPSRSDLVSFIAGGGVWPDGAIVSDGTVAYLAQVGETAISDLPGLVPHGLNTPNHFAENAIPSATDMSDALAASMSYGPTTLLGQDYLVTKVSRIYSRDGASLEGVGRQNDSSTSSEYRSRILRSGGGTYDVIDLYTDEVSGAGVPLSCRNITFKNVTFDATGSEPTGGAYVKCSDRIQNGVFDECSFDNGYAQLDLLAPLELTIKNCGFGATGRTLAAGDAVTLSPDARATDGIERKPADVHIYSNQFKEAGTAQFRSFVRILAGDGVYIHDNHFQNSREDQLRIDPADGGDPTESLASIIVTNNYFDSSNRYHVYMTGQKTKYRDLSFNGNQFRAASGVSSIVSSATIAISRVRILGNTFRDCDYSAIRCTTTPAPERWIVNDNVFSDNNVLNDSQHGDIRLNGDHLFSGNMFQGGGVSGYAINLDGSASVVSGNDLTQSDASLVILGGASASVFGNAGITNPGTVAKAGCGFNSVADLIADTSLSYAPAQYFETTVAAGDVVTALGYTYEVAASGASDHDLTTSGGVKLYCRAGGGGYHVEQFGGAADNSTDNSGPANIAMSAISRDGGGTLNLKDSGVYLLTATGDLPASGGTWQYAVEVESADTTIIIGHAATVKLDDDQSNDVDGAVEMFVCSQIYENVSFIVDGVVDGNFDGQSTLTDPRSQRLSGNGVTFYYPTSETEQPTGKWSVYGSGGFQNMGSSPVWVVSASSRDWPSQIQVGPFWFLDCGEGPEVAGALEVTYPSLHLMTSGDMTMVGDGLELAFCQKFEVSDFVADYVHKLEFDAETSAFTAGSKLTGGTSGAVAYIERAETGVLYLSSVIGTFADDETITDGAGGSATADGELVISGAGTAIELYGSSKGVVNGGRVNGCKSFIGTTDPDGGTGDGVNNVTISNIQAIGATDIQPFTISGKDNVVYDSITLTGFKTMFRIDENDYDGNVVLRNVIGQQCGAPIIRSPRRVTWHGGGNVNSIDNGVEIRSENDNLTLDLDFMGLDFRGAASNGINISDGVNSGMEVTGVFSNTTLDDDSVTVGAGVDITGLSWKNTTPRTATMTTSAINDVAYLERIIRANGVNITEIEAGFSGQSLTIVSTSSFTVFDDGDASGAGIFLVGAANFAMTTGDTLKLEYRTAAEAASAGWYEVGRSVI